MFRLRQPSLEIGAVVRSLKRMALATHVIVFLVCHVSKVDKSRELQAGDTRDCLPAGQMVHTAQGPVPIERLTPGQRVASRAAVSRLQDDCVTEVWETGEKPILRITTKLGRQIE